MTNWLGFGSRQCSDGSLSGWFNERVWRFRHECRVLFLNSHKGSDLAFKVLSSTVYNSHWRLPLYKKSKANPFHILACRWGSTYKRILSLYYMIGTLLFSGIYHLGLAGASELSEVSVNKNGKSYERSLYTIVWTWWRECSIVPVAS